MKNLILTLLVGIIITPQYHDITPNDGFMDSGTIYNPYEVELENGY